jgi:hypothetical protein
MEYVARTDWGAIDSGKPLKRFWRKVQGIVVHHTTGPSDGPWKRVRGHDRYHVETKGWDSIAYNWLVSGETGEIFEGRGHFRGAATRWHNSNTVSVAYIGDSDEAFTDIGKEKFIAVVGDMRKYYGDHLWVKNHKDFSATTCPGENLTAWVNDGMPDPEGPVSTIQEWDAITLYVQAAGAAAVGKHPIRRRSRGQWVSMVQKRLNERLNAGLKVDGIYGRKSVAACKKFQSQFALKVDGVVGPNTWRVLWMQ